MAKEVGRRCLWVLYQRVNSRSRNKSLFEICDLSAHKRCLQLSENLLLAPMSVDVTRNEDKDIKVHFSSLFLKLKLSFSFTVTLINIHNYPSQFPHLLRFVTTRMLYCTEVFTLVLYFVFYFVFYHFELLLSWKVAQRGLFKGTKKLQFWGLI